MAVRGTKVFQENPEDVGVTKGLALPCDIFALSPSPSHVASVLTGKTVICGSHSDDLGHFCTCRISGDSHSPRTSGLHGCDVGKEVLFISLQSRPEGFLPALCLEP